MSKTFLDGNLNEPTHPVRLLAYPETSMDSPRSRRKTTRHVDNLVAKHGHVRNVEGARHRHVCHVYGDGPLQPQ